MKQTSFFKNYKNGFGGALLQGRRKEARPLSTKHALHIVIRSDLKGVFAPGNRSLEKLIFSTAQKFNIKIYEWAANWSHIHAVIKINSREDYVKFIRSLNSLLAQKIRMKLESAKKVFTLRSFTRIISWGRDFKQTIGYQILNQLEAQGWINRNQRANKCTPKPKDKPSPSASKTKYIRSNG